MKNKANTIIEPPIKIKLNELLTFNVIENTAVPIGIKSKATVNMIPKTRPIYSLSTSRCTIEKNWTLKIVRNKLKENGKAFKRTELLNNT